MESEKQKLFVTYISQEEFIDKTTYLFPFAQIPVVTINGNPSRQVKP